MLTLTVLLCPGPEHSAKGAATAAVLLEHHDVDVGEFVVRKVRGAPGGPDVRVHELVQVS